MKLEKENKKEIKKKKDAVYFSEYYSENKNIFSLERRKKRIKGLAEKRLKKLKELKGEEFG